jgi:HAD superfamily hydrolase (TIGR01509 family)
VTTAEQLVLAEGGAKAAIERGDALDIGWSSPRVPGARGWGAIVGAMLVTAGLAPARAPRVLDALWTAHRTRNFWSLVPDGLSEALGRARAIGVLVAVVSNSEGILESILEEQGILRAFDLVVDSGLVGVEKPDPNIFRVVLDRFGVPPARALHLGDTYATDVIGARAAGLRVALIDPHGHFAGRHADVPRVPGAPEVADAIAAARRARGAS